MALREVNPKGSEQCVRITLTLLNGQALDLFWTGLNFPDIGVYHNSEGILLYDRNTDAPTTLTLRTP